MENYPSFQDLVSGTIHRVSDLNARIKDIISDNIGTEFLWVAGEISNFRGNYASGHWYFSLKDEKSQISAVCFKWANQYIKFTPENGTDVICCGQVGVYEKNGTYQLNVRYIEPKGVGAQALALEQLKEKLQAEGLFDTAKKRAIPALCRRIGVVTSPAGAAIRDILKVLYRRFPDLETVISPARVQGDRARDEIVKALELLYRDNRVDLIIIARGGGSKEDLWVFNDEAIARKLHESPVPVISAIGHQTDFTICDMVADVRASTPSMAAELAVKEKNELINTLADLHKRYTYSLSNYVYRVEKMLAEYKSRIVWAMSSRTEKGESELATLIAKIDSLSPLKVLERGYSISYRLDTGVVIRESRQISEGDRILVRFQSGKAQCVVEDKDD